MLTVKQMLLYCPECGAMHFLCSGVDLLSDNFKGCVECGYKDTQLWNVTYEEWLWLKRELEAKHDEQYAE